MQAAFVPLAASPTTSSSFHLHREPPPGQVSSTSVYPLHQFFPTPHHVSLSLSLPSLPLRFLPDVSYTAVRRSWIRLGVRIPWFSPGLFRRQQGCAALASPQSARPSDVVCHHPLPLFKLDRYVKANPYESGFHCSRASRRIAERWLPYPNTSTTADAVPPCGVPPVVVTRRESRLGNPPYWMRCVCQPFHADNNKPDDDDITRCLLEPLRGSSSTCPRPAPTTNSSLGRIEACPAASLPPRSGD